MLKWLGLGSAGVALAGCGGQPAAPAATTAPGGAAPKTTPASKTVTVSFSTDGTPETFAAWEQCLKDFEAKNTTIKVERKFDPQYTHEKAKIMLGAGTAASVQRANDNDNFLVRAQGLIRGFDDWIARDLKKEDFIPAIWNDLFVGAGGEIVGACLAYSTSVIFYNVKHFEEAKIEPRFEWNKAFTFQEYNDALNKLAKKDASGKTTRFSYDADNWMTVTAFYNWGGKLFNDCETKCALLDNDAAMKVITWWEDVYVKRKIGIPTGENRAQLFNSGLLSTVWCENNFALSIKSDVEYDVMPVFFGDAPAGTAKNMAYGASKNFLIPTSEKEPEAAWELLKWCWTEPGARVVSKIDWGVPPFKKVAYDENDYKSAKRVPKHRKLFVDGAALTSPCPDNNPAGDDIAKWFNRTMNELRDGQKDAKTFLTERVQRIDDKIKETQWDKCKNWTKGWKLGDKVAPLIPPGMGSTATANAAATAAAAPKK